MRCANCQLCITRLRRHRLSEESPEIVERVQRWVHPRDITGEDYLCHSCWELINRTPNEEQETRPQLGHRNVCAGCGRSILRIRSKKILRPDMTKKETQIGNIIAGWITPRQLTFNDKICVPCHLRAQRIVDNFHKSSALVVSSTISQPTSSQEIDQEVIVKVEEVGPDLVVSSTISQPTSSQEIEQVIVKVEDVGPDLVVSSTISQPTSSPPIEQMTVKVKQVGPSTSDQPLEETSTERILRTRRVPNIVESEEVSPATPNTSAEQITLPTLRRAADTARHCLFLKCNNTEKRHLPDCLRKRIIKEFNFFIPKNARICNFHIGSNLFHELYAAENAISRFTAAQIEEIVFLLSDDTKLDFKNPENIDDHLFKFWFGWTKIEFNEILIEIPQLNYPKLKIGLSALLCKMRTGDSNERISAFFQVPRRTLEDYMKQAQKILQEYAPTHLGWQHNSSDELVARNSFLAGHLLGNHEEPTE